MYRNDQDALSHRVDSMSREADRLRQENEAMRQAMALPQHAMSQYPALPANAIYQMDVRALPLEERARLAQHTVKRFPVWLVGVLNILTFGIFPFIHFSLIHDKLPRASHNDPSAAKAIGFQFIPYFNLYWVFFNALRLSDRLTLQFRLRGQDREAPKGLLIAACIFTVFPYLNLLIGYPILWTITVCVLQSRVNEIAALSPSSWDASPVQGGPNGLQFPVGVVGVPAQLQAAQLAPGEAARQAKAQKLVTWSHVLGWGGLVLLFVGSAVGGVIGGPVVAGSIAAASGVSVVVGAIVGQVGRGMQGRAL